MEMPRRMPRIDGLIAGADDRTRFVCTGAARCVAIDVDGCVDIGGAMNDMFLRFVVRDALTAIGFHASDLSPRVLRNTSARRQLLDAHPHAEISAMPGLTSSRTITRNRQTLAPDAAAHRAARER